MSWEDIERFERIYSTEGHKVGEVWELVQEEDGEKVRVVYAQKSNAIWRVARCKLHGDATDQYFRARSAIRTDSIKDIDSAVRVDDDSGYNLEKWRRG